MKKYIAIVHEKGNWEPEAYTKYEFEDKEEMRSFIKAMRGILICVESYSVIKK